jgi:DNA repair protein SbcD/Mre11
MAYRILHLADLHLERSFAQMGCFGELARRRRQGLRDALRGAGAAAHQRGCQAVTIGGDLFEGERAGAETAQFLVDTFRSWAPIRVLLAPGNHDPLVAGSLYLRTAWPENVHLFRSEHLEPVELDGGLSVWGLGHREPAWKGNPLAASPEHGEDARRSRPGGLHIALFHGAEIGSRPADKAIHGPFSAAEIRARSFDLALCGHYHSRRIDMSTGLVYPGSPEPLAYDEAGPRGPVLVEVEGPGKLRCTGLDTNQWHTAALECDLEGAPTLTAAVDRVSAEVLAATAGLPLERTTLRVDLTGGVPTGLGIDLFDWEAAVRETTGVAGLRIRDLTAPALDLEGLGREPTTRGAFVRMAAMAMASAGSAEERAVLTDALRYGLEAFAGGEVGLR